MRLARHCLLVLLPLYLAAAPPAIPQSAPPATHPTVETQFSPEEDITPTIVKQIDSSQKSLNIAAFAYTSPDIAAAAMRGHDRGVDVHLISIR
jgi:phosphatidylserine/phosphatidylglycerophosphate/cardiolipin synthase-like enzyme